MNRKEKTNKPLDGLIFKKKNKEITLGNRMNERKKEAENKRNESSKKKD